MPLYLSGLYQLDPFFQACQDGVSSGLYRLDEVAPDQFHQSEYYLNYFHANVLEDEVQFILQLPGQGHCRCRWACAGRSVRSSADNWRCSAPGCWPDATALAVAQPTPDAGGRAGGGPGARCAESFRGGGVVERELEIARLILRGYSSKAMAERLAISPETVKVHRRHLYAKLDISSQPELFSLFLQSLGHDPEHP